MEFYLGTHEPGWLAHLDAPLFISHRRLSRRRKGQKSIPRPPRAKGPWALDSGGFTEVTDKGGWVTTPEQYVAAVRYYAEVVGPMDFAAPMDWMCEPIALKATGKTVAEHQALTVANYLLLREVAPELPWIPVLQGWDIADYHRCVGLYEEAGVDLTAAPRVGVGTVCRRQATGEIEAIIHELVMRGIRLHGFGVKMDGLARYGYLLTSADSLAWSSGARMRQAPSLPGCTHKTCTNCWRWALAWREKVLRSMDRQQLHLELTQ